VVRHRLVTTPHLVALYLLKTVHRQLELVRRKLEPDHLQLALIQLHLEPVEVLYLKTDPYLLFQLSILPY
jgi:hypothetical protein